MIKLVVLAQRLKRSEFKLEESMREKGEIPLARTTVWSLSSLHLARPVMFHQAYCVDALTFGGGVILRAMPTAGPEGAAAIRLPPPRDE